MSESLAWTLIFTVTGFFTFLTITISVSYIYGAPEDERSVFIDKCSGHVNSEYFRCSELALKYNIGKANQ